MRCFFMKRGRICSVEYLNGKSDEELIGEARQIFLSKGLAQGVEGFEVWDHTRFIYRFVADGTANPQAAQDGLRGPPNWLSRIMDVLKPKFASLETILRQVSSPKLLRALHSPDALALLPLSRRAGLAFIIRAERGAGLAFRLCVGA